MEQVATRQRRISADPGRQQGGARQGREVLKLWFYCREVITRLRAAAAVQQLAASQQQPAAFNSL